MVWVTTYKIFLNEANVLYLKNKFLKKFTTLKLMTKLYDLNLKAVLLTKQNVEKLNIFNRLTLDRIFCSRIEPMIHY